MRNGWKKVRKRKRADLKAQKQEGMDMFHSFKDPNLLAAQEAWKRTVDYKG